MFDAAERSDAGLSARDIAAWQHSLSTMLTCDSGLEDAEKLDAIRALEELVCTATAAQAKLTAEFATSQRIAQAEAGVPAARRGRGVAAQIAFARRESPHRGQRHLGLASVVADELPHTWAAWAAGRITEWKATLVARETACLTLEDRLAVDEAVAADADRLEQMGERELVGAAAGEAARLDPASVVRRRRRAEADRHVSLRPAPDTMTWLTALLPVEQGVAVWAALSRAADSARAAGDERGRGQVMADALVARVREGEATECGAAPIALHLTMTDRTLLCGDDESAYLQHGGPIPGELARELVAGALADETAVELRRLYADPHTGALVAMESRARAFPGSLARFIRLRDQVCRTPWCDAPIRHVDHSLDHDLGGPTDADNGQGLCEACNHAKQAPGWRARPGPDGIVTELPTGHRYRSAPRTLVRIRSAPITVDLVLAG